MTQVRYEPARGLLRLSGHAGAAPKGRDLVCAALSILTETVAAQPGAESRRGEGWCELRADPALLAPLLAGFRLLARDWPEYVKFEEARS